MKIKVPLFWAQKIKRIFLWRYAKFYYFGTHTFRKKREISRSHNALDIFCDENKQAQMSYKVAQLGRSNSSVLSDEATKCVIVMKIQRSITSTFVLP